MRNYAAMCAVFLLTGCTLTPKEETVQQPELIEFKPLLDPPSCVFVDSVRSDDARCGVEYWLDYWAQASVYTWPERQGIIEKLDDSPISLLKKVLLSQPVNTPYKARLRAQHWVEQLTPHLSKVDQRRLQVVVASPSEHMLELESAITTLSRVNNGQSKTIESQEKQINELKAQLEALINIESNLMSQEEETQQ